MPNHGMVVQAGMSDFQALDSNGTPVDSQANTADGWSVQTTGYPIADGRPKLEVTYTTEPVTARTFQRGDANGYAADTMVRVRSGSNVLMDDGGEGTDDGLGLQEGFLDGANITLPDGTASSDDNFALVKFGNVFGAGASQSPADVPVAKAWVVLTTGDDVNETTGDSDAHSTGPYSAHAMLRDWDTTTLHNQLGAVAGLQVADNDISPALSVQDGMIRGSEVWFDVTSYLEGVRQGAADYGVAIQAAGTADGWSIHFNGSNEADLRPRLVVYSGDVNVIAPGLAGDFNDDGMVDAADFTVWRNNLGTTFDLNGNGNESGTSAGMVDSDDYLLWKANFGTTAQGGGPFLADGVTGVPEPATIGLALVAMGLLWRTGRQRSK
jgi:hypothetical protein